MKKQANSKSCFVCGVNNPLGLHMSFYDEAPGRIKALYTVPVEYQGYPRIVHGGIIAAMLDEVAGRTVLGKTNSPRWMVTAKLDVRYRKPVPIGEQLVLLGILKEDNGLIVKAHSEIRSLSGVLLAEAEQTLMEIPREVSDKFGELPKGEWQVYEDGNL